MLDVDPAHLNEAHLMFMPPMATGVDHERQLVRWRKNADPLNTTTGTSTCDFKSPPYTERGLYPDKGGIFSWINVWRKGQLFHTPGAFLPARTAGANPLMALPDAQIELVGHDDPKGFTPFNFARHRFLRFQRHSHDLEPLFRAPAGENTVTLTAAPGSLAGWLPADTQQNFENVQVWLRERRGRRLPAGSRVTRRGQKSPAPR